MSLLVSRPLCWFARPAGHYDVHFRMGLPPADDPSKIGLPFGGCMRIVYSDTAFVALHKRRS